MEQRSLRLGDLVDDYCSRERRVTNHVIVALVGDSIRQTRCSTCETEHEYKEARMPRKKTLTDAPDLAGGVLKHKPAVNGQAIDSTPDALDSPTPPTAASLSATSSTERPSPAESVAASAPEPDHDPMPDAFIGHRPLIRATLPKTENDVPPPRAIPEFTMHQRPAGRGFGGGRGGFRPHGFGGHGFSSNGSAPQRDGNGPDGNRAPGPGGPGGPGGGPGGKSRHRRRHRRPR
jgi:hypothetical protein